MNEVLKERGEYEALLKEHGYTVSGGGVDLTSGEWDIFIEDDEGTEHRLHGAEEVERMVFG